MKERVLNIKVLEGDGIELINQRVILPDRLFIPLLKSEQQL